MPGIGWHPIISKASAVLFRGGLFCSAPRSDPLHRCERSLAELGNGGDHLTVICVQRDDCVMTDRKPIERRIEAPSK
jgi:hypothetical protein